MKCYLKYKLFEKKISTSSKHHVDSELDILRRTVNYYYYTVDVYLWQNPFSTRLILPNIAPSDKWKHYAKWKFTWKVWGKA